MHNNGARLIDARAYPDHYRYSERQARSLLKEAKYYFYDTGAGAQAGADAGAVLENAVACALHRELHLAEDQSGSKATLGFLRDKEKREERKEWRLMLFLVVGFVVVVVAYLVLRLAVPSGRLFL